MSLGTALRRITLLVVHIRTPLFAIAAPMLNLGAFLGMGQLVESEDLRANVEQTKHFTMLSQEDLNFMLEYHCKVPRIPTSAAAALLDCQAISGLKTPA